MKTEFLAGIFLAVGLTANAKVELPNILSDNMVLQRNSETCLWGKAAPGAGITITAGWTDSVLETVAGADGKWRISMETPDAGGPYSIVFDDGEKTVLDNILIGEVWLCSGQSNMEMPMAGSRSQPVKGAADHIISARPDTPIRMCKVSRNATETPAEDCEAVWMENTPENVAATSAAAYYFAMKLQSVLDVPVGIIVSCWSGSPIRAWIDRATFDANAEVLSVSKNAAWAKATTMFNGMIAPLTGYDIRGLLWYQGEADIPHRDMYRTVQAAYVQMMRQYWNDPELPFYYVQLAPYSYDDPDGFSASLIREAQMLCLDDIPYSGMAVTMDVGDAGTIHPADKETVGNRLAYLALTKTYGIGGIDAEAPVYSSWKKEDGRIIVTFRTGPQGLSPVGHDLGGFEVSGEDNVFHPATARVMTGGDGKSVEVFCDEVENPVAVRYGFHNFSEATLFNGFGIPASPFRTDIQ